MYAKIGARDLKEISDIVNKFVIFIFMWYAQKKIQKSFKDTNYVFLFMFVHWLSCYVLRMIYYLDDIYLILNEFNKNDFKDLVA